MLRQKIFRQSLITGLYKSFEKSNRDAVKIKELLGNKVFEKPDHLAFRSFNFKTGKQPSGIEGFRRIFSKFGYEIKSEYSFDDDIKAVHMEVKSSETDELEPKLFISEYDVDKLPLYHQHIIQQTVKDTPDLSPDLSLININTLDTSDSSLSPFLAYFSRPWSPPLFSSVLDLNIISQYLAWTLLHGNSINHCAYRVVNNLPEIYEDLVEFGIKMNPEGVVGDSELQQTSTIAPIDSVQTSCGDIAWTTNYCELIYRGPNNNNCSNSSCNIKYDPRKTNFDIKSNYNIKHNPNIKSETVMYSCKNPSCNKSFSENHLFHSFKKSNTPTLFSATRLR